jgi:putative ABC transport system permease protein
MLRIALAGMRAHVVRTLLTGLAVMLGVGFFAGTLVYADTARAGFADEFARPGEGVDVAVNPPDTFGYDERRGLDARTLARVAAVPGVAHADGRVVTRLPMLGSDGRVLDNDGRVGWAVSLPRSDLMSPFRLASGGLPTHSGDAVLDKPTAKRLGLAVGDTITVLDPGGQKRPLRLVGIVDFGATRMFHGWSVVGLSDADLASLTNSPGYASIVVAATAGTDPAELRDAVEKAVEEVDGTDYTRVVTGEALRASLARGSAKYASGFLNVLLASTLVALVVACLVVHNTFTILVAQRTRELALLRTIGGSRRQVFSVVAIESAAVGALASIAGVAFSLLMARLIFVGRNLVGDAEPEHALVVAPASVAAGLLVGMLATLAAAVLPALAATRVSPLAALRGATDAADPPGTARVRAIRLRLAAAVLIGLAGVAVMSFGTGRGFDGTTSVLGGGMVVFVALVVALPLVVVPLTRFVGWLPSRLFGVPARLAVHNARRNPRRVAATTTALMVGLALVSLFSVVLATARDQANRELAENFPVDFAVKPVSEGSSRSSLPDAVATELGRRTEFQSVVRSRVDLLWIGDGTLTVSALQPGREAQSVEVMAGSLGGLAPSTVALRRGYAYDHDIEVGDTISGRSYADRLYEAKVVALFDDAPVEGEVLIGWSDFGNLFGPGGDQLLVTRAPGVSAADARVALDTVLDQFPLTSVTSQAERSEQLTSQLEQRLTQFGVLLGISIVIAILGIMDTLALSVLERTRESATLRALGMARRQLRGMLMVESVLMALVGATIGIAFGVSVGWIAAGSLIDTYGHGAPTVPVVRLLSYVALAAVAAVLASLIPARRAARTAVVSALTDT